ncbi:MAG: hypothetical protein R3309_01725 [Reinekea sp.]|nr:hypothetical protein [Reinekea sp.]
MPEYHRTGGSRWVYAARYPKRDEDSVVFFRLYINGRKRSVCKLTLVKNGYGWWETHCDELPRKYRNKGYGIKLYDRAIKYALERGWEVGSSTGTSFEAARVWQSKRLAEKYLIKRNAWRYVVYGKYCKCCDGLTMVPSSDSIKGK